MSDMIDRQKAIDAVNDELGRIDHVPQWVFERLENRIKQLPPAQLGTDLAQLGKEIAELKRRITSQNQDYYTGYMSALSTVEGIMAEMEGERSGWMEKTIQSADMTRLMPYVNGVI